MIVLGGGIGGILGARIFKTLGFDVQLLEGRNRLGGCATSFKRNGLIYNAGATTLPGLHPGFPLDRIFQIIEFDPKLGTFTKLLDPVCEIHFANGKDVKVYSNLYQTIEEISQAIPVKGHDKFFPFLFKATNDLLTTPFNLSLNKNLLHNLKLLFHIPNIKLSPYLVLAFKPAIRLLKSFYEKLSEELLDFFRAQNFITSQAPLEQTSALNLLLAMGYYFTGIAEVKGGIGALLEALANSIPIQLNIKINVIKRLDKGYLLKGENHEFFSKKLVLAIPILEHMNILTDKDLREYFKNYHHKISPFSAFVVYGRIKKKALETILAKHHLFIFKNLAPKETSGYFYLSFLSQPGEYETFTISTHTPLKLWLNLNPERYEVLKRELEKNIISLVIKRLGIDDQQVSDVFSATPFTFKNYTGRFSLGGLPCTMENPFWKLPPNLTPFPGLYHVGDHAFAGQGFLGIALGCLNLYQSLEKYVSS